MSREESELAVDWGIGSMEVWNLVIIESLKLSLMLEKHGTMMNII